MDLTTFLLDQLFISTTSATETPAEARNRRDAITEMFQAFEPRDRLEASIAAHCVGLQFMMDAALRDSAEEGLEPAIASKLRAGATAISRTLFQWVSKLEKSRQQKLKQTTETPAAKAPAPSAKPLAAGPPSPRENPPARPAASIAAKQQTTPADPPPGTHAAERARLGEAVMAGNWPPPSAAGDNPWVPVAT